MLKQDLVALLPSVWRLLNQSHQINLAGALELHASAKVRSQWLKLNILNGLGLDIPLVVKAVKVAAHSSSISSLQPASLHRVDTGESGDWPDW